MAPRCLRQDSHRIHSGERLPPDDFPAKRPSDVPQSETGALRHEMTDKVSKAITVYVLTVAITIPEAGLGARLAKREGRRIDAGKGVKPWRTQNRNGDVATRGPAD